MKKRGAALLIAALMISVFSARGHQARAQRAEAKGSKAADDQEKGSVWMKHKLEATQKILAGMTRGDYELIEKNAQGMQTVAFLESWVRADIPEYQAQLHAFDHANAAIVRAARDKNLDGVTLAYAQLTISCVQCHRLVRDKTNQ